MLKNPISISTAGICTPISTTKGACLTPRDEVDFTLTFSHEFVKEPTGPVELPSPVSALVAHHLVQTGALPAALPAVTSSAWPHVRRCVRTDGEAYCAPSAAIWTGDEKLWWDGAKSWRVDLRADPGELAPQPLGDHPLAGELAALAAEVEGDARDDGAPDEDVVEALRSLGYLD